jgi:hypothetical protein
MGGSFKPDGNSLLIEKERKADLGTRCRAVAGSIVAVVWGALVAGESKFRGRFPRDVFIAAAGLGVLSFFLDYAQTLFEYPTASSGSVRPTTENWVRSN